LPLGVSEAQLEALGPLPPQLLASVRARGNPPECAAFVAYLEALPSRQTIRTARPPSPGIL
jgi:hypothetical protein